MAARRVSHKTQSPTTPACATTKTPTAAMQRKMGKVAAEMAAWNELSHSTKYEG
nr:hypothetical protein [uncultured Kingella sp.]